MSSDERVGLCGELAVAVGDPARGVGRPADGDALVADRDVGVVVGGLGSLREPVHERDRGGEAVEGELALERAVDLRPPAHARQYGVFHRSRKPTPTTELVVAWLYRPLAHLVVLALLPLRVSPPAVVLAGAATALGYATQRPFGALGAFLVLTLVLSVNYNLQRI